MLQNLEFSVCIIFAITCTKRNKQCCLPLILFLASSTLGTLQVKHAVDNLFSYSACLDQANFIVFLSRCPSHPIKVKMAKSKSII